MASSEILEAISRILTPINWTGDLASFPRLQDHLVPKIREVLRQNHDEDGSKRPRTYAFLYLSHLTHFHDAFQGYSDDHLPYTDWTLPSGLHDQAACKHFLKFQHLVVSEDSRIFGARTKRHAHFKSPDDCPLKLIRQLGRGMHGTVDCVQGRYSGKLYARKIFEHKGKADRIESFKQELEVLKNIRHHHLVRYTGSYTDSKWIAYTMLPIAEEDLSSWLTKHLGDPLLQKFFGCLASAVAYLHEKNVRHKDIKLLNVLIYRENVYISDFGSANQWNDADASTTMGEVAYPYTKRYAAPEILESDPRNRASDIFSLGCVFLEMVSVLHERELFDLRKYLSQNGTHSDWYSDNREAVEAWVSLLKHKDSSLANLSILDMILRMTDEDRAKRPSASAVVKALMDLGARFACENCHRDGASLFSIGEERQLGDTRAGEAVLYGTAQEADVDGAKQLPTLPAGVDLRDEVTGRRHLSTLNARPSLPHLPENTVSTESIPPSIRYSDGLQFSPSPELDKWIVKLHFKQGGLSYRSIGFFVNIPDIEHYVILTAGQNLIDNNKKVSESLEVELSPTAKFGVGKEGIDFFISTSYREDPTDRNTEYDYGAILIPRPQNSDRRGFGLSLKLGCDNLQGSFLSVSAYKYEESPLLTSTGICIGCSENQLEYNIKTEFHWKGSPVYMPYKGQVTAIAIHTGSRKDHRWTDAATRLNEKVLREIFDWVKIGYKNKSLKLFGSPSPPLQDLFLRFIPDQEHAWVRSGYSGLETSFDVLLAYVPPSTIRYSEHLYVFQFRPPQDWPFPEKVWVMWDFKNNRVTLTDTLEESCYLRMRQDPSSSSDQFWILVPNHGKSPMELRMKADNLKPEDIQMGKLDTPEVSLGKHRKKRLDCNRFHFV